MAVSPERFLQQRMQQEAGFDVQFWTLMYERLKSENGSLDVGNRKMTFPKSVTPKKEKLWNSYQKLSRKKGLRADYTSFLENYSKLKEAENNKFMSYLSKANDFGFTGKMIRKNIEGSPEILAKLNSLYGRAQQMAASGDKNALNQQSALSDILYNRGYFQGIVEDYGTAGMIGAGVLGLAGGIAGYNYFPEIKNAPKKIIDKVKQKAGISKSVPKTTAVAPYNTKPTFSMPKASKSILKRAGQALGKAYKPITALLIAQELLSNKD